MGVSRFTIIERVVTIMKLCDYMQDFRKKFARVLKELRWIGFWHRGCCFSS